ncbi:GtrA family protein [Dongia sp.]|uniref:GtrA family protein n=1 Tax=Dongia sp. TaxID=1977262 RepID=UPI0035B1D409
MRQIIERLSFRKVLVFGIVGGLASATYAVLLYLCLEFLRLPVFWGSAIAFAIAIPVSYFGHRRLTFQSTNLVPAEMARFITVQIISLAATSAIVHLAAGYFASAFVLKVVVAVATAPVISFILFELWVYRPR